MSKVGVKFLNITLSLTELSPGLFKDLRLAQSIIFLKAAWKMLIMIEGSLNVISLEMSLCSVQYGQDKIKSKRVVV